MSTFKACAFCILKQKNRPNALKDDIRRHHYKRPLCDVHEKADLEMEWAVSSENSALVLKSLKLELGRGRGAGKAHVFAGLMKWTGEPSRCFRVRHSKVEARLRRAHYHGWSDDHERSGDEGHLADDADHRADARDLNEAAHAKDQRDESGCEFHDVHVQDLMSTEEKMVSALL